MRARWCWIVLLAATAASASERPPSGGGGIDPSAARDDLSPAMRADIQRELSANVERLRRDGVLPGAPKSIETVSFQWPLKPVAGYRDPEYHGISNFVDLNPSNAPSVLDWNCGARSYALTGYSHAGTDIFLWPYPWIVMDQTAIDIVAAAPGMIIGKVDGNFDRQCAFNNQSWNAVYVQHADGTVAWYGHMKSLTQTSKPIGQTVAAGEFLGKVGSSGSSTGPHLHFEVHTDNSAQFTVRDPFQGACQAQPSLWAAQPPYYDSKINKIATHSADPGTDAGCPNPTEETPHFQDHFLPGQTFYYAIYYHDQRKGQATQITVYQPHGAIYESFSFDMASVPSAPDWYAGSYWYWTRTLLANAPSGVWIVQASFQGQTFQHRFFVGDVIFADGYEAN